jgi:hypothetical protein
MGNEYRLRIAGLLMTQKQTTAELADTLGLKQAAVLEHLAMLRHFGLLNTETRDQQTCYRFNTQTLYDLNRTLLSREALPTPIDNLPDEAVRKALLPFFEGQRLTALPMGQKFQMLIEWLVTQFDRDVRYPEQQVNEIIARYHEDYATLRRAMIDAGLMARDHGVYWRVA